MATVTELLNYAKSLTGKKVTVPTNPYGGQCVSFVDHLTQWATGGKYNLSYTNAIDLLSKARANGFEVFYFNGTNAPQPGDIWVTRTYSHAFGHTGIFVTSGGQPVTLEQNVDGNADALTNGGWVRQKQRLLYPDGTMNYNPYIEKQTLVGWFRLPLDKESTSVKPTIKKGKKSGMYGSFLFTVKEGDGEFSKGAVFMYNAATNSVTGMHNSEELKYVIEAYKKSYGEDMRTETYSTKAPVYRRVFGGLNTDTKGGYSRLDDIKKQLADIAKQLKQDEILNQLKEIKEDYSDLADQLNGNDIAQKRTFVPSVNLNIRKTASSTGEKVGVLKKGESIQVVGSAQADGYYWVSFMKEGQLVYVASKVVGGEVYGKLY